MAILPFNMLVEGVNICISWKRLDAYFSEGLSNAPYSKTTSKITFEDGFPFPKVGYVNSQEGKSSKWKTLVKDMHTFHGPKKTLSTNLSTSCCCFEASNSSTNTHLSKT